MHGLPPRPACKGLCIACTQHKDTLPEGTGRHSYSRMRTHLRMRASVHMHASHGVKLQSCLRLQERRAFSADLRHAGGAQKRTHKAQKSAAWGCAHLQGQPAPAQRADVRISAHAVPLSSVRTAAVRQPALGK